MISRILPILGPLLGLAASGLGLVVLVDYVRRVWGASRSGESGSAERRLWDQLDQLQMQNYLLLQRLERIEATLELGPSDHAGEAGAESGCGGLPHILPPGRGDHGVLPR